MVGDLKVSPENKPCFKLQCYWIIDNPYYFFNSKGDSGGPLTFKQNGQHVLIGDVSSGTGEGCARVGLHIYYLSYIIYHLISFIYYLLFNYQPGEDGYYGRISYLREWLDEQMNSPVFCGGTPDADDDGDDDDGEGDDDDGVE